MTEKETHLSKIGLTKSIQILVFSWDRIPTSSNQFWGCWLFGSMVYARHGIQVEKRNAKLGQEPCLTTNWPLKGVPCAPRRVFGMGQRRNCRWMFQPSSLKLITA